MNPLFCKSSSPWNHHGNDHYREGPSMANLEIIGQHYRTSEAIRVSIVNGVIAELDAIATDDSLPIIAPGMFDLQINGFGGTWFSDENLTVEAVLEVLQAHYQFGMTHLFPTIITNSFEAIEHGFRTIRTACEQEAWADAMVLGCHLEGPYFCADDGPRGAHPVEHVRGCDFDEFQKWQSASGNRIRLVTLAPEADGAVEFIRGAVQAGVAIAIGHTGANAEQIEAAVDAGARLSTHLGNGAHGTLPRHPNYIWDQLGERRLTASLIVDGHHLPASFVRSVYYAKGPENIVLTCDASGLAGCEPGVYGMHGGAFEVLDSGKVVIAGQEQYLAGSGVQTDICIHQMMQMTGCSLAEAWDMATDNPARLVNVQAASLEVGAAANLVVLNPNDAGIGVERTIANGVEKYASS